MKTCCRCKIAFPLENFNKRRMLKSGYTGACKNCTHINYLKNRDKQIYKQKTKYNENAEYRDYVKNRQKLYTKKNKKLLAQRRKESQTEEKILARRKKDNEMYKKNSYKIKQRRKRYCQNNTHKITENSAKRHAMKLKRMPCWLTKEQKQEIKEIYKKSKAITKETGIPHHVDHIIPLQGKEVSGLHVPWNLQILTATDNCSKHNKYEI